MNSKSLFASATIAGSFAAALAMSRRAGIRGAEAAAAHHGQMLSASRLRATMTALPAPAPPAPVPLPPTIKATPGSTFAKGTCETIKTPKGAGSLEPIKS